MPVTARAHPADENTGVGGVRDRFGAASVARGTQLGRDPGWSTPVLPEHE